MQKVGKTCKVEDILKAVNEDDEIDALHKGGYC